MAERFALHPNVARHHLEKLTGGGYLDVEIARADGERPAGRPSKRYRATGATTLAVPLRQDSVLASLLAGALDALGAGPAEALADQVGYDYGRDLARRMDPGERAPLGADRGRRAVADALTAHGFAARAEATATTSRSSPSTAPSARGDALPATSSARSTAA